MPSDPGLPEDPLPEPEPEVAAALAERDAAVKREWREAGEQRSAGLAAGDQDQAAAGLGRSLDVDVDALLAAQRTVVLTELAPLVEHLPAGYDPGWWINCGPGWWPLLLDLHAELVAVDPNYVLEHVRNRWGVLSVYASPGSDAGPHAREVRQALGAACLDAQWRAATVCERCGAPGRLRDERPWPKTLCEEHVTRPR